MSLFELLKNILIKKDTSSLLSNILNNNFPKDTNPIVSKVPDKIIIPERSEPQPEFLSHSKDISQQTDYGAYFKNGILFNVKPRNKQLSLYEDRQTAYHARYIISDGIKYDLENSEDIKAIHIPKYLHNRGISSPVMNLDYIIKMRLECESRPTLAVPLAYKVANLMIASNIGWNKKDFYRLVIQLWSVGEINYADYLLKELKKYVPEVDQKDEVKWHHNNSFDQALRYAKQINTDFIQIGYLGCVCSECAPFQNRIYSISGRDKKFPRLPEFIIKNKGLHCNISTDAILYYPGCTITQYIYKPDGTVASKEIDAPKYSNRPFVDDRSDAEKQNYENWKANNDKQKSAEDNYFNREYWIDKYNERLEYQQIINILGDKAPKSYSGYQRMKKNNTANFQKILELAKENNIKIN